MKYHHLSTAFRKFVNACDDRYHLFPAGSDNDTTRMETPRYGRYPVLDNDQLEEICAILERYQTPKNSMYAVTYSRWDIDHSRNVCDYTVYPAHRTGNQTYITTKTGDVLIATDNEFVGGWKLCDVEGNDVERIKRKGRN